MMSTTTGIDNLDNNLLGEILTRLPAETIVALKLMNKKWYNLISDPSFINKHSCFQTSASHFCWEDSLPTCIIQLSLDSCLPNFRSETIISFEEEFDSAAIHASCHGLLLVKLEQYISRKGWHSCTSTLCILNPLTQKRKLIPSPLECKSCRFGLVFDPTSASSLYYYNHYRVVCLVLAKKSFEFKIFMPEKGCWRDCNTSTRMSYSNGMKDDSNIFHKPVCFRGTIHWLTEGYIIAFNLDKEEGRMIEIPKSVFEMVGGKVLPWWSCTWLGIVEDEVNLVVVAPYYEIITWVLCDYENNKWEIKRNDVIKTESNHEVYIQPMFFNGERFLLNFRTYSFPSMKNNWQEYDVRTGVSRSLHSNAPECCTPHISTLTEV